MRKVICDEGNFQVADKNPLSVNVVGATGLKMPFDGAVVCSSMTLTPDLDAAGLSDFLYFPYRHTAVKRDDNSGFDFVLPSLKTAENKSFRTNKNYICFIEKDSILIEYVGSDIHTGSEIPNAEGVIENPILGKHKFGANVINSCYARILIYEFDDLALAEKLKQLGPIQIREGANLTQELAKQLSISTNEVPLPSTFQMHAFDLSGRATDCASSLKNIGVERLISRPNLPDNTLLVQFIDLHGNTVRIDDFPFTNIIANQVFTAYSTMENGTQFQHPLYTCALPLENKLKFKKRPFAGNDDQAYLHNDVRIAIWPGRDDKFKTLGAVDVVFDIYKDINKDYLKHRFIRFCVFHPSQLFQTAVGGGISPYPEVATPGFTIPNYRFNESRMNYFSDRNKVEIFNSPNDFFIDLEKTASSLVATDKLYQINWKANAHVYVKGSAAARGLTWKMINVGIAENTVQPLEEDIASLGNDMVTLPVYNAPAAEEYFFSTSGNDQTGNGSAQTPFASIEKLNTLLADGTIKSQDTIYFKRGDNFSGTAITATEIPGVSFKAYGNVADANPTVEGKTFEEAPSFLKIPQTRASRANRNNVYQVVLNSVATPEIPAKKVHTGFVRPLNLPSIPFTRSISPDPVISIVNAYYKLPTREVKKHSVNIPLDLPSGTGGLLPFPKDFFYLGLDEGGILPKAKIIRRKTFAEIQTALNQHGNELLHLLVFNANAGTHHFFALKNLIGIDQENETLEEVGLGEAGFPGDTFPAMFHAEDIAYAAIVNAGPTLDSTFTQLLITAFRTLAYSNEAHNSGHIPLHDGEVGSIFRKAISKGADVKAIFWEQSIAALNASAPSYLRGESNNVKMKNIINNTINDKRGYAVIDRATRQQGSFHQKTTIIVRTGRAKIADAAVSDPLISVVAYIGGIDIADGRWDDRFHHEHDPDRPSNTPWYDVHLKVTGDAAYDILMNFKHRMDAIVRFANDADPNAIELDDCSPRFLGEVKGFINELDVHIPKANENPGIARAGVETMVQINRTIPPFSCHVDPIASGFAGDDSLVLGNEGELGILASYHKILNNARKFVLINDQYFMNSELAALLHKRLTDEVNPLDFAIILLPRELGESAYVDPVLYKARSKAMHILIYGHQGNDDFANLGLNGAIPDGSDFTKPTCGNYNPKSATENIGIAHKVVFLSPINKGSEKTQNIYVHAKHMIVDDVWMTIGSANMGARSMTYDWEINANIVDLTLHKGGTMAVRNQRIEILARMVGIPPAYSAVFQDPYSSFQLLKAIEKNGNKNIYPAQATVKKLPIDFLPFEPGPFVANLGINSAALTWVVCNILDPDGRNQTSDRIGYFVQMFGIGKHPVDGGLNLIIDFEDASEAAIRQLITVDPNLRLRLTTTVTTFDDPIHPITSDPMVIDQYALDLVQEDVPVDPGNGEPVPEPLPPVIRLRGAANNNVYLAVSAMNSIVVKAELVDGDTTLGFSGSIDMQPNHGGGIDVEENEYPPILGGATINRTIVVSQETT